MGIFSDIRLEWGADEHVIPAERVLGAIAVVEDVFTLADLNFSGRGRLPLAKLSMAYGALLRYAGAKISDEEVYNACFGERGRMVQKRASEMVFSLQLLMIPPEHLRVAKEKGEPEGKEQAAGAERAGSSPSATGSS